MGRGRLRRGCSLEVIFEEDPDFCSHLDSLDGGVAIRFGIKEPDETISLDSLLEVEEYQVRFQDPADAEQVFRSLDGFIDVRNMDNCMVEWDEFSMDSNSGKIVEEAEAVTAAERDPFLDSNDFAGASNAEKVPSGRRSRVSRRQIIQATWLGYSSSSDESVTNNDPGDTDKTNGSSSATTARQQRRRSPSNRLSKTKLGKDAGLKSDESIEPTSSTSAVKSDSSSGSGGSPNLVTSVEDFTQSEGKEGANGGLLKPRIQLHLRSSPNNTDSTHHVAPHGIFGRSDAIDIMEKDTLDSYISTMTDETDTNAYTFADPFDDTHSVASTSYESSSGSTSSTESNGSVCTVNSFSMQKGRSKSNGNEGKSSSSGVSNGNRPGGTSGGGGSSKYRSNLKVELVTQLNKSQEANLHSTITTSASSSATVNPSNLYSGNSHLNLQSSSAPALTPAAAASSTSSGVTSKYPNNQQLHRQQQQQQPLVSQTSPDQDRQSFGGDVKRVRALFELRNHSRTSLDGSESIGSSSNGSTCPSSPESTTRSVSSRNGGDTSPCGSSSGRTGLYSKNGRRSRASPQNQQLLPHSTASASTKVLRSAYSNLSLNQMSNAVGGSTTNLSVNSNAGAGLGTQPSYDYVDLLVNDKVVIEDAPDIYQTNRSRRPSILERDVLSSLSTSNSRPTALMNLSPQDKASGGSLRRSRSMGTGISALGSPSSACSVETGMITQSSSKTNILAEELPAPDTVKNVRNVFENMLKMRSSNNGSESSVDITPTGFSGSFSIVKKSLSYIKSNPTSRIYRSESMRDDFPSLGRRYGKPVLTSEASSPVHSPSYPSFVASSPAPSSSRGVGSLSETVTSNVTSGGGGGSISEEVTVTDGCKVSPRNKSSIERKISEPAKFSPKINSGLSPCGVPSMLRASLQAPLTEEDSSFSSNVTTEDYRSRKYVHADVLQKIRSAGTTTTYFGGKIVAKTIKNRKIPLSRRHTFDFQDYVGISGDGGWYSNYDPYNSSNYYRDDETFEKCQNVSSTEISEARSSSNSSRPALEIPLKSSSSTSIYASRNTTISGALDSIFAGGVGGLLTFASKPIDTTPRIISVLPKSPPGSQTGSPVKSCSPVSSVIEEGRNSPEGCEASNEKAVEQDGNNNNLPGKLDSPSLSNCTGESKSFNKKFSQITEGAWF